MKTTLSPIAVYSNCISKTLYCLLLTIVATAGHSQSLCFDPANDFRYHTYNNCTDVSALDVNNDGHLDVVAAGGGPLSIHIGNGDGTFIPYFTTTFSVPSDIESIDFDNDGDLDLYCWGNGSCIAVRNEGDGTFTLAGSMSTEVTASSDTQFALGDVTGNGISDIIVPDPDNDKLVVIETDLLGIPQSSFMLPVIDAPTNVQCGDLNNDGIEDLVVASNSGDDMGIYYGEGGDSFTAI
ncbi:MAG: VCBS repeat-containing protein, partial [Flavobacteriales bacterium]|nr:VCBS repeat-containing protein [Flavobacteriales bacterium]